MDKILGRTHIVLDDKLVSNGLDWATKCHHSATFVDDRLADIGTRECATYRKKIFEGHAHLFNALSNNY